MMCFCTVDDVKIVAVDNMHASNSDRDPKEKLNVGIPGKNQNKTT